MPCDYSKYPKAWRSEIVPRILERAKNRCEICNLKNKAAVWRVLIYCRVNGKYGYRSIWFTSFRDAKRLKNIGNDLKRVKVILTVAHLDHDETNQDVSDDRLKAMCQYCHLNYDAKEKMRRIMEKSNRSE